MKVNQILAGIYAYKNRGTLYRNYSVASITRINMYAKVCNNNYCKRILFSVKCAP